MSNSVLEHPIGKKTITFKYIASMSWSQVNSPIQYCYAHLLREVEDLEKEFPDSEEV